MEPRQSTSNQTINDKVYQFRKMDARAGTYIFVWFSSRQQSGRPIIEALGHCTRTEYDEIQTLALQHVTRLDSKDGSEFPIPVLAHTGVLVGEELQTDSELVYRLTVESIMFNLKPFLVAAGSK